MIHFVSSNWRQIKPLPQTYVLLGGLTFAYAVFIYSLGFHLFALIAGLAIALLTWSIWMITIPSKVVDLNHYNKANLLLSSNFEAELKKCDRQIFNISHQLLKQQWQDNLLTARNIHRVAQEINDSNPSFLTELLETLHLVLDICREIVECILARTSLKSSSGLQQVEQRLVSKQSQLREIYHTASQLTGLKQKSCPNKA